MTSQTDNDVTTYTIVQADGVYLVGFAQPEVLRNIELILR